MHMTVNMQLWLMLAEEPVEALKSGVSYVFHVSVTLARGMREQYVEARLSFESFP